MTDRQTDRQTDKVRIPLTETTLGILGFVTRFLKL